MRRVYLKDTYWDDPDFDDVSADGMLLYLYLCSNPSTTMAGTCQFSVGRIGRNTRLGRDRAAAALQELVDIGKVRCAGKSVTWVLGWVAVNLKSPSMLKNAFKDAKEHGIFDEWVDHNFEYITTLGKEPQKHIDALLNREPFKGFAHDWARATARNGNRQQGDPPQISRGPSQDPPGDNWGPSTDGQDVAPRWTLPGPSPRKTGTLPGPSPDFQGTLPGPSQDPPPNSGGGRRAITNTNTNTRSLERESYTDFGRSQREPHPQPSLSRVKPPGEPPHASEVVTLDDKLDSLQSSYLLFPTNETEQAKQLFEGPYAKACTDAGVGVPKWRVWSMAMPFIRLVLWCDEQDANPEAVLRVALSKKHRDSWRDSGDPITSPARLLPLKTLGTFELESRSSNTGGPPTSAESEVIKRYKPRDWTGSDWQPGDIHHNSGKPFPETPHPILRLRGTNRVLNYGEKPAKREAAA